MAIQTINLGTAPSGAGGDTFRSTGTKVNENFTNNTHAASRLVGTAAGNVMQVGAFGLGAAAADPAITGDQTFQAYFDQMFSKGSGIYRNDNISGEAATNTANACRVLYATMLYGRGGDTQLAFWTDHVNRRVGYMVRQGGASSSNFAHGYLLTSGNTTRDSNGFIKAASPIVQLFADKIESNEEALEQNPEFEKVDIGHYLIKNTEGFAKEGWWIEVPTDTNGNRICAVEYQTLENGDLEIKTFKKKLNDEGDIVANLDAAIDIPYNANGEPRWIDVRLHSVNKAVVHKVPRTEKQARMVQQVKYAPQLTYITKYEDLFDDAGNPVIVDGQKYQKPVTHIQTDKNGTPILSNQPVINDKGEPVFEWVQAIDSEDQPIFDDVPVLDEDGKQIYDEVTYEPQQ
ncbi:hypothetical protein ASC84_12240 [Acinetobacter sp. Root1280]|uniref:phage tail fiber protein n=1 Tax=Acinetobacter sp. Root1280 TaxID=1736444 RepID=UPI0007022D7D|nr:hypothetical protein [Acinetobacter sp. Root1280]KQW88144.1 hypothetical protein ASC84_12240 [Acinetobacter sp. Root1280]